MYNIDTGSDGNLMPFKVFKILFPKSTVAELCKTKLSPVKTYNQSSIEQLGMCSVKLNYKDECVKCRFFAVPGDGPVLLGMPDIELLSILKITVI